MGFLDRCIFAAAASGTGDFTIASGVVGFQTPAQAGAIDTETYSYVAQSSDLSQWEYGHGTYSTTGPVLARTSVLGNSLGTTAKISFTKPPQVMINILAEDLTGLGGRTRITSSTTFYVRTTGNDANDGLTAGTAWLTIDHALNYLDQSIDVVIDGQLLITLDIGPGTFQGGTFKTSFTCFNGSNLQIQGDSTATTTVTDGFVFTRFAALNIFIVNLTMSGVGSGALVQCPPGAFMNVTLCKFDMGAIYNFLGCVEVSGGYCAIDNTEITGNGDFVLFGSGSLDTLTYTGNPSFVDGIMRIPDTSNCMDSLGHTGTATGYRYTCQGSLWFPFGGGAIQSGPGDKDGLIGPSGVVFTGTNNILRTCHTQSNGGIYNYQTPATGFTLNLVNTDFFTIIDPAGTLATGTIVMPPAPIEGQRVEIRFSQVITALTISPNAGQSVVGAPGAAAVGDAVSAIYRTANTTWYFGH